ncbi:unnamed protein product [Phytophthora fragariaefolia]|uniref:Unnamed protein product n=1 Tax=Phytophthora fragariaefolia TaxID=1490495 RepID=A0A9W6U3A3_9STRA|nr:unnamed protein product [Phytophthora fragariaefolia]
MLDRSETWEGCSGPRAVIERGDESTGAASGALYSLPPAFDEIDFHSKLLGKPLVDLAWKVFTGREASQITTRSELEDKFLRVDQRKTPTTIPATELPIASFSEFVGAYVAECVRQAHRKAHAVDEENSDSGGEEDVLDSRQENVYGRRRTTVDSRVSSPLDRRGRSVSSPRAAMGNTKSFGAALMRAERKQRPLHPQPQQRQSHQVPRSLKQVQSKIRPELNAQRQKVLRVKKTQSQRMAETLARARLAEYDARRELQDVRHQQLGPKKMPISEVTKGTWTAVNYPRKQPLI